MKLSEIQWTSADRLVAAWYSPRLTPLSRPARSGCRSLFRAAAVVRRALVSPRRVARGRAPAGAGRRRRQHHRRRQRQDAADDRAGAARLRSAACAPASSAAATVAATSACAARGRRRTTIRAASATSRCCSRAPASRCGRRATASRRRARCSRAHPDCDVISADDGLQHYRARARRRDRRRRRERAGSATAGCCRPDRCASRRRASTTVDAVVRLRRVRRGDCQSANALRDDARRRALRSGQRRRDIRDRGAVPRGAACTRSPASAIRRDSSRSSRALGIAATPHPFPDHHRFVAADLAICPTPTAILMTEKDAVKCERSPTSAAGALPVQGDASMPALVALVEEKLAWIPKLLEILVCPVTKGPLVYDRSSRSSISQVGAARLSDPRRHSGDARGRGAQARAGRVRVTRDTAPR